MPSDEWLRRFLSYSILFGFTVFVFFYGVAESFSGGFRPLPGLNSRTSLATDGAPAF
jgi:hypothetical protein